MGNGRHELLVDASIEDVWQFVSNLDSWAPLVPGYIEHEIINDKVSDWKFKIDIGLMKKKIYARVNITEWTKPSKVTFSLKGLNEKFTGSGSFEAERSSEFHTIVKGILDISTYSPMEKIITPILNKTVPDVTTELTINVARELEKRYSCRR
ncbi:SRPBCC family protein [Bacillus haikouensis]|uniref:CoxG family protein n=1 Tax=Bacillus haikouensis TaxID=1510468 RepID=UPI001554EEF5|nr:SRPBCC family protein [Bacillus haikouensis]NQD65636.1 SRPBCC family protein [Bacillus haikouensis]